MSAHLSMDIYRDETLVETREFHRDIIKVGRLSSAHLRLEDEKVSRIHSVIEVSPAGELSIIDMGSAVGTLVNGKRINKSGLSEGDEILVGSTRLVLHLLPEPAGEVAPPAPPAVLAADPSVGQAATASAAVVQALSSDAPPVAPPVAPAAALQAMSAAGSGPEAVAGASLEQAQAAEAILGGIGAQELSLPEAAAVGVALAPADAVEKTFDPRAFVTETSPRPDPADTATELRFMWGNVTLNVAHYKPSQKVTIGEHQSCAFYVANDVLDGNNKFPLLSSAADGEVQLSFTSQMKGFVRLGSEICELDQLVRTKRAHPHATLDGVYTVGLGPDARVALEFGGVCVLIHFVRRPRKIAVPWGEGVNYQFLNLLLFCLFGHLAMLITAYNFPYDTDLMADDLFKSPNRFAKFILKAPEPVKNTRFDHLLDSLKKSDPGQAAAKAKGDEGKMGRKNAEKRNTRSAPKAIDINSKDIIKQAGIFTMLKKGGSAGVSTLFGKGGLGGDLNGALGGLVGSSVGDARGVGGLGLRGGGGGGGGLSGSTFGVGGIGTKGRGGGLGGYGTGVGGLGKKKNSNIDISSGTPIIMGSLDRELIRRVIRAHIAQIRYCYERELQSTPGLYGKISVKFTISAMGGVTVARVDNSTMKNRAVESCVTSRVKTWTFPKPKGGGIVLVTYPFVFKQGG